MVTRAKEELQKLISKPSTLADLIGSSLNCV